jgi:succinate-acetate transporter protein
VPCAFCLIAVCLPCGCTVQSSSPSASQPDITKAGGGVTLAFAILAWYHAAADIIAATFGRTVVPVWALRR